MDQQYITDHTAGNLEVVRFGDLDMAFDPFADVIFTFTSKAKGVRLLVHGMSACQLKTLIEFMQDGNLFEFRGDRYLITNVEAANLVPLTEMTIYQQGIIEAAQVLGSELR